MNSKDHESEVGDGEGEEVISDAALMDLLDRSDLERKWRTKLKAASGEFQVHWGAACLGIRCTRCCLTIHFCIAP